MESEFYITNYLGSYSGKGPVDCILKKRYADFKVQEIMSDRSIVPMLSIEEARKVNNSTFKAVPPEIDDDVPCPEFITDEDTEKFDEVFNGTADEYTIDTSNMSKEDRTSIHQFLRERYKDGLESETNHGELLVRRKQSGSKRRRWRSGVPDYVHFTMAKENKETTYALGIVAKMVHASSNHLKSAGIKDRRAVTCQRVSGYRIEIETLNHVNNRLRDIALYDFKYDSNALRVGSHWGNRFSIILRNIDEAKKNLLELRLKEWTEKGFINYFGTQRFGSCESKTADIGKLILARKWKEAVMAIFENNNEGSLLKAALDEFRRTENATNALKMLKGAPVYASNEGRMLRDLKKNLSWQDSILNLPIGVRSLYVHAYQSLLWNKLATLRVTNNGKRMVEGDVNADGELLSEGSSPFDIHVPLPNANCEHHPSQGTTFYETEMNSDALNWSSFASLQGKFALGDSFRPLFVKPEKVDWEFISYSTEDEPLQVDLTGAAVSPTPGDLIALKIQFDLPAGSYATVALREITCADMGKKSQKAQSAALAKEDSLDSDEKSEGKEEVEKKEESDGKGETEEEDSDDSSGGLKETHERGDSED